MPQNKTLTLKNNFLFLPKMFQIIRLTFHMRMISWYFWNAYMEWHMWWELTLDAVVPRCRFTQFFHPGNEDEAIQLQGHTHTHPPPQQKEQVTHVIKTEHDPTHLSYLQGPRICVLFLIYLDLPASLCDWKGSFLPLADRITCASIPGNWKCTTLWSFEDHISVQRHNAVLDAIKRISRRVNRLSCKAYYFENTASVNAVTQILQMHTHTSNFI